MCLAGKQRLDPFETWRLDNMVINEGSRQMCVEYLVVCGCETTCEDRQGQRMGGRWKGRTQTKRLPARTEGAKAASVPVDKQ